MSKFLICIISIFYFIGSSQSFAMKNINDFVPNAKKIGESKLSVMLWDVYNATLYAPNGKWSFEKPFALELEYLRDFSGEKIANRSVQEIRKQGFQNEIKLATWHTQMRDIFPDVNDGDKIVGFYTSKGETVFYDGNNELGHITDPEFSRQFFSIWLSPKTSAPNLRLSLIGENNKQKKENHETSENISAHRGYNND